MRKRAKDGTSKNFGILFDLETWENSRKGGIEKKRNGTLEKFEEEKESWNLEKF